MVKKAQKWMVMGLMTLMVGSTSWAGGGDSYPIGPDPDLTPGALCDHPDSYRYPERIAYCERNVDTYRKVAIIQKYDQTRGYRISQMNRQDFKIDHYFPLCAGGSNSDENLWPQHKSVYAQTDPLEALVCEKMSEGVLRQQRAIELIQQAKNDLRQVGSIIRYVQSL